MSKVDAQRAMREARYARNNASGPSRREAAAAADAPKPPVTRAPRPKPAPAAEVAEAATTPAAPKGELCGHKSMNGRACTREAAHAEKSHRYG
jgi:hypothetical protein